MSTISKISTFEAPKFSQNFSPLGSVEFWAWALGPRPRALGLPRPNTGAFGSRMGPRFGGRTAPRGQGRHGCGEQHGPWPRTKDLGRENPLEALRQWDFYVRKWMNCGWFESVGGCCFQFFWTNFRCFLSQLPFLHPFVCRQFLFWSILERPLQSKIDFKLPARFNGPRHPDCYQPDSVKYVALMTL